MWILTYLIRVFVFCFVHTKILEQRGNCLNWLLVGFRPVNNELIEITVKKRLWSFRILTEYGFFSHLLNFLNVFLISLVKGLGVYTLLTHLIFAAKYESCPSSSFLYFMNHWRIMFTHAFFDLFLVFSILT